MRQRTAALAAMPAAVLASCAGHFTYQYRDVRVGCLDPLIFPVGLWVACVQEDLLRVVKADGTDLKFVLRDDLSASPPPAK